MNSWSLVIFMSCNLLNTLWNCNPPLVSHIAPVSCSKGTFYASFHQRLASWYYRVTTEWCDTTLEYHGSKDPTQSSCTLYQIISQWRKQREKFRNFCTYYIPGKYNKTENHSWISDTDFHLLVSQIHFLWEIFIGLIIHCCRVSF